MRYVIVVALLMLGACGTLEHKTAGINPGDSMDRVRELMGSPRDRQFKDSKEAWQYCVTGAGFGFHDYRIIWFREGRVTGITSYKDSTPGANCASRFRPVIWEEAPDQRIEIRNR